MTDDRLPKFRQKVCAWGTCKTATVGTRPFCDHHRDRVDPDDYWQLRFQPTLEIVQQLELEHRIQIDAPQASPLMAAIHNLGPYLLRLVDAGGSEIVALGAGETVDVDLTDPDVEFALKAILRGPQRGQIGFISPLPAAWHVDDSSGLVTIRSAPPTASLLTIQGMNWRAVAEGVAGDSTTIELVDPGANNVPLSVVVSPPAITITLATGPTGTITTRRRNIRDSIAIRPEVIAVAVLTSVSSSNTLCSAEGPDSFSGGVDAVAGVTVDDLAIFRFLAAPVIAAVTEPADGDIQPGECFEWFDPTNGAAKRKWKGKSLDGTVVAGETALT